MKVTLGGDRLGSGNKNKIALRNYERSTHNLTQKFTSSMQCGVLYPFLVEPAMRGDTFEINLNADGRTIPTKGPLFGSFKMQVDIFQCPWRLYQAILHNNPTAIGLKMNQVMLPQLSMQTGTWKNAGKMYENSLMKYLGYSGIGIPNIGQSYIKRNINAIPALAYYDIFKTYYANKQEENAYVIKRAVVSKEILANIVQYSTNNTDVETYYPEQYITAFKTGETSFYAYWEFEKYHEPSYVFANLHFYDRDDDGIEYKTQLNALKNTADTLFGDEQRYISLSYSVSSSGKHIYNLSITDQDHLQDVLKSIHEEFTDGEAVETIRLDYGFSVFSEEDNRLVPFKLKNIDDMRLAILSKNNFGSAFTIGNNGDWTEYSGDDNSGLPYSALFEKDNNGNLLNNSPLNGLVVKTYQSDLFNNWVNTEWIDGENGIAAVTAISTASGSFTIDSLNLAEKLYNMLNRIAVADGTYEGWQDAVYTQSPKRHIESPIYLGGMSSEIVFEEIVQTAPAEGNPLGTLAGKGKILKRKGGHVSVKVDEASFIIGIVSLTPRINYTQGNAWYLTELQTMDDLHKPALDGIGFENLIGERLAWFDTRVDEDGLIERSIVGKVPAWINYMTAVDKGYGDFAQTEGNGFMLLQREYEQDEDGGIKDLTTYIDPTKYNYAFAYTTLEAQNFWVQILSEITARRLMSAKQIPNI